MEVQRIQIADSRKVGLLNNWARAHLMAILKALGFLWFALFPFSTALALASPLALFQSSHGLKGRLLASTNLFLRSNKDLLCHRLCCWAENASSPICFKYAMKSDSRIYGCHLPKQGYPMVEPSKNLCVIKSTLLKVAPAHENSRCKNWQKQQSKNSGSLFAGSVTRFLNLDEYLS